MKVEAEPSIQVITKGGDQELRGAREILRLNSLGHFPLTLHSKLLLKSILLYIPSKDSGLTHTRCSLSLPVKVMYTGPEVFVIDQMVMFHSVRAGATST